MTIDTTLVIDFLNGKEEALEYLEKLEDEVGLSRIVIMEMVAGCVTKRQLNAAKKAITGSGWQIIEVDEEISQIGGELFEMFYHSRGLGITDAMIAATALYKGERLATHNVKHFRFIKGLDLVVPY